MNRINTWKWGDGEGWKAGKGAERTSMDRMNRIIEGYWGDWEW